MIESTTDYIEVKCENCLNIKNIKESSFIQNVKNHCGKYICSSCSHRGIKKDELTKNKISKSLSGRKLSEQHKNNIKNSISKTWRSDSYRYNKIIGIFYGRFDPPHNGHLSVALSSLALSPVNEVWWIPSYNGTIESSESRIDMINHIIKPYNNFKCSDFDIKNKLDGKAITLVHELMKIKRYSKYCFYWIIGSDRAREFDNWEKSEWLSKNIRFWIFHRQRYDFNKEKSLLRDPRHVYVKDDFIITNISSSDIQNKIYDNETMRLTPVSIQKYIEKNNLYSKNGQNNE